MPKKMNLVIVTGMSGAGKTVAMQSFEDLGYFCVDNMPPTLLPKFFELVKNSGKINKVALIVDLRSRVFYDEIDEMIEHVENNADIEMKILFLDASDKVLVARYKETRRVHPLAMDGRILDGVKLERELLATIKTQAQITIDTSELSPRKLRSEIFHHFENKNTQLFHVDVVSFGFKYGVPIDADIVMDVRFLTNPYYVESLKNKTGLDPDVSEYVMQSDKTEEFYQDFMKLLYLVLPGYKKEGKSSVTIAIGCTGGQHRSVALTQRIGENLKQEYSVSISHRDIKKRKETVNRS